MNGIIRRRALSETLGVSECTIWRWVRSGHFPKPIQYGPNAVGWLEADVTAWLEAIKTKTEAA